MKSLTPIKNPTIFTCTLPAYKDMVDLIQSHFEHNDNIIRNSQWEKLAIDDLDPIVKTNYGYKINFVFWQRKISKSQILSTLVELARDYAEIADIADGDLNQLLYTSWSTKAPVIELYNELSRNKRVKIYETLKEAKLSGITPSMTKFSAYYHADNNHLIINSTARVSELACFIIGKVVRPSGLIGLSINQIDLVGLQDSINKSFKEQLCLDNYETRSDHFWINSKPNKKGKSDFSYQSYNTVSLENAILSSKLSLSGLVGSDSSLCSAAIYDHYINAGYSLSKIGFKTCRGHLEATFNFDLKQFSISQFKMIFQFSDSQFKTLFDKDRQPEEVDQAQNENHAITVISDFCNTIINQFNCIEG